MSRQEKIGHRTRCHDSQDSRANRDSRFTVPTGTDWIHEIKHDGYRLIVQKDGQRVRLFTRNGHDWSDCFPLITEAALRNRNMAPDDEPRAIAGRLTRERWLRFNDGSDFARPLVYRPLGIA